MPALIPILLKVAPYLALIIAAVAAYFGIRHAGAKAANEKNAAAQEKVREILTKKIDAAVSKDEAIDQKVEQQIAEIKKTTDADFTGDRFKF